MSKLTEAQRSEIIEKYRLPEHNCGTLARLYGLDNSSIRNMLIRRGVELKTASEIKRKYTLDYNYFDKIDTEEKAYFLGFLYADGYNNEKRGEIHLSLQEEDKEILEKFRKAIGSNRPLLFIDLSNRTKNNKDVYRFDISSKQISYKLHQLGCVQAKSMILEFPTKEMVPNNLIKHFIRGYFDGDGCFVTSKVKGNYNQFSVSIVSTKNFCLGLKGVVEGILGINTYTSKRHKDRDDSNQNFHVGGNLQIIKFLDWLYEDATIYLQRKFKKYKKSMAKRNLTFPV